MNSRYDLIYGFICGRHPYINILHFQWLAVYRLRKDLREELALLNGRILDVGCGEKPYEAWIRSPKNVFGIDERPGPKVDQVVGTAEKWNLADASFDALLCTQVLEHVELPHVTINESFRCLRPGAKAIFTAPFIYGEHGSPKDFNRFSGVGLSSMLSRAGFEVLMTIRQGGIGSTLGLLFLGWLDELSACSALSINLRKLLLPVWIVLSALVNLLGWLLDTLDPTERFYSNVMIVARRPTRVS
jgi:SAM-dependent methyltransferase